MITLEELARRVASSYPVIGRGLLPAIAEDDDPRLPFARLGLAHALAGVRSDGDVERLIEAFAVTSIDFLRLQARFYETGRYARTDTEGLVDDLYGDDEKMSGYYLDGLALTYALWPNHADLLRHFVTRFVAALATGSRVVEVGPGHGLMAALLLARCADSTYVGLDISASSLRHAASSLEAAGVPPNRYELHLGNVTGNALEPITDRPFDAALCCEVLEHVDDPRSIAQALHDAIKPGGVAFVSTVANLEAEDHVYLFDDADQIRRLLEQAGFEVVDEQVRALPGAEHRTPLPLNYSAVLKRPEPG